MNEYKPTIGLEVHAEMETVSKMFCNCKNDPFNADPNTHICPVCTAQPGALPAVNFQAVKNVLKVGLAVDGTLADFSEFDRKNYFYPDIPKAYQISQLEYPLVSGGKLAGVDLTRIHLEEDTATSVHKTDYSLVDFNRAGVPLMELVTEPVTYDTAEAAAEGSMNFAKELQLLLRTLGVGEANLEKGEMRIEANISVSKTETLNTKVEVKNLNSFKIVGQAIAFEVERQIAAHEAGETVVQETRGWDENKQRTFSQRTKETADDYRYFPDPDIPKYKLSEVPELAHDLLQAELPELPWVKRQRYSADYGLKSEDIEFFLRNPVYDGLFAAVAAQLSDQQAYGLLANYLSSDLSGLEKKTDLAGDLANVSADALLELIGMIQNGDLSSRGAKDTLAIMYAEGGSAKTIADERGLIQKSDPAELKNLAQQLVADNPNQVAQYQAGEEKIIKFFVGQGMKATGGSANPQALEQALAEALAG